MANEHISSTPRTRLPRHVAVIMDGNGRWAKQRHLPRFAGHRSGLESVRSMVKLCLHYRIEALTLFAFSSENWRRPKEEVGLLMNLFMTALDKEVGKLHKNGIRLRIVGDTDAFSPELQRRIADAESLTRDNTALTLAVAVNYGGRWDITEAARSLAAAVASGEIRPEDITPDALGERLALSELPEPDLFIRTGGEQRISNFLLWQLAYTELYFTPLLWPEFREAGFEAALDSFASRQRRFGKTGDQVEQEDA
ncbi:polyprenyl diphosphate synthase [Thiohalomonas denitrificans]|uniref:Ditrans,polycis-undecaprenyl-diphosphate synthase ((2E,6E)-farnesyl-diphosphate specific) n=1 Tax=Thiohalomonas denitrificans TaxID=415747 RepID=A0A1G5Q2H1_9GAMM|nr:polyprenyl diphosphate synthase [Thiohalomonas denitrificans]SCZ55818.1 undecaprenyl diphosphate synthase [Thiohalomonas denitrificans]